MGAQGIVVPPGQDPVSPGRSFALKLRGGETGDTIMIGDEVTVGGPGTCAFMPRGVRHAWKSTGAETGKMLFLYTPARAGGLIEEQQRTRRGFASMNEREL